MGTRSALEKLPPDVIRIEQRPVTDDPGWLNYGYVNSIACLDHPSAAVLNDYDMVPRSDVDTLLTRAWNCFHPTELTTGRGAYSNDDKVRENVTRIAASQMWAPRSTAHPGWCATSAGWPPISPAISGPSSSGPRRGNGPAGIGAYQPSTRRKSP